jgi:hypothetical protein
VYYLVQSVSSQTSDGITRLAPGTRVTLVKDLGATLRVTDGTVEVDAGKDQLTNDLNVLAAVSNAAARQANATAAWQQAQRAAQLQTQGQGVADQQSEAKAKTLKELAGRRDFLEQEKARLTALVQEGRNQASQENYDRVIRRRITSKAGLVQDLPALNAQLASVEQELAQVSRQILQGGN